MKTPLAKYLKKTGIAQAELARRVGVTRQAINQMLRPGRRIQVVEDGDEIWLEERYTVVKTTGSVDDDGG